MKEKPTAASAVSPDDLTTTLDRLKAYTEFESVTIHPSGAVEVKYAPRAPKSDRKQPKPPQSAIESIKLPPPPFAYERQ